MALRLRSKIKIGQSHIFKFSRMPVAGARVRFCLQDIDINKHHSSSGNNTWDFTVTDKTNMELGVNHWTNIINLRLKHLCKNKWWYALTADPLILATLNFGVWVNVIILDPVILAFLLPTTLKRCCIQIFVARYFRELARLVKFAK